MRNAAGWPKSIGNILLITVSAAALLSPVAWGKTAEPPKSVLQKASAPKPTATAAIPLAEVVARAAEASTTLVTLQAKLTPASEIQTIQKLLPEASRTISQEWWGTERILRQQPSLAALQVQQELWKGILLQANGWLKVLTLRSTELREGLNRLVGLKKIWSETLEVAQASRAPETILNQINELLSTIETRQISFQVQLSGVLDLQSRVARQVARSQTALTQVVQAQAVVVTGILTKDSLPIWSPELWTEAGNTLSANLRQTASDCWQDIRHYLRNPSLGLPLHIVILVVLSLLFGAASRRMQLWDVAAEEKSSSSTVFARPYSAALIGTLFFATRVTAATPLTVEQLFEVLVFIPIIRLTQPVIDPRLRTWVYILWPLFFMDTIRQALAGTPLLGQAMLLLEALAGMLLLGWSVIFGQLRLLFEGAKVAVRVHLLALGARFALLVLTAGLLTGAFGYTRLAGLLVSAVIVGATLALAIYASFRVLRDLSVFILRIWPLRLLLMVQQHRALLEQRVRRLLVWMAIFGWLARFLNYVGLLQPVFTFCSVVLATKLQRGSVSISLEDVLAFLLTVWAAYLVSAFIRFILKEDVYPRMGIGEGASYVVSSLLNYLILALGLVVGLGLMGIDLTRLTVLAGAFGVGLGFGLQSVVNNFVCGLILLFERPIHVGDLIEIGDLLAEVRYIGIRASTVRTRQGADLIVPNSELVTERVTNWTRSDRLRRIQLPVGVNYGADPQQVIGLLEAVARRHPKVLAYPPVRALFMSYGDSSIDFELRAWTDEFLGWRSVRSDLAVAVYEAVNAAGMTFPFPQRDVHVVRDAAVPSIEAEPAQGKGEKKTEHGDRMHQWELTGIQKMEGQE